MGSPANKLLIATLLLLSALVIPTCKKGGDAPTDPVATASSDGARNILLIVTDTVRADHLGCYGYERATSPNIDALAEEAVVFERFYSHSPWTMPSVASMFTSLVPRDHGLTNWKQPLAEDYLTLAEHLGEHGYHTTAVVSHVIFRPKYHFDQGFDHFDFSPLDKGYPADVHSSEEVTDGAIAALAERPMDKPFFAWVHYFDPHNDYLHHEEFDFGRNSMARYDSEIAFTDHHVGRLLDWIREQQLLDDTVVVVVADHGEEFGDHGGTRHSQTLYDEVLRVPCVLRVPGFKPARDGRQVAMISLAPTLLSLVDVPIPAAFTGKALPTIDKGFGPSEDQDVYAETLRFADKRGVVSSGWKLIQDREEEKTELYNLVDDPAEKKSLVDTRPELNEKLGGTLDAHYQGGRTDALEIEMPDKLREELKELGYIE